MQKDMEGNAVVLEDEEMGSVKIADDVVAIIAALAATEVDGVSYIVDNLSNALMGKVGLKKLTKGVRVDVSEEGVKVDLAVVMEYGYSIPVTCQKVQQRVSAAIENMTGLNCLDVNIRITGVSMKKDK